MVQSENDVVSVSSVRNRSANPSVNDVSDQEIADTITRHEHIVWKAIGRDSSNPLTASEQDYEIAQLYVLEGASADVMSRFASLKEEKSMAENNAAKYLKTIRRDAVLKRTRGINNNKV